MFNPIQCRNPDQAINYKKRHREREREKRPERGGRHVLHLAETHLVAAEQLQRGNMVRNRERKKQSMY